MDEIRSVQGYGETDDMKLKPLELKLAEQLVESLDRDFEPRQYRDTFQDNLRALIEAKREGKAIAPEPAPKRAPVIDMMEALKRSLQHARGQKKKPLQARTAHRGEARRRLAG